MSVGRKHNTEHVLSAGHHGGDGVTLNDSVTGGLPPSSPSLSTPSATKPTGVTSGCAPPVLSSLDRPQLPTAPLFSGFPHLLPVYPRCLRPTAQLTVLGGALPETTRGERLPLRGAQQPLPWVPP